MKFRFLLWMLGRLMAKASRKDPDFQKLLSGKDLRFRLFTLDGKVSRIFTVNNQRVSSKGGGGEAETAFSIGFRDAAYAVATMTGKNQQVAFMKGIQDKDIVIGGNAGLVMWFQGLVKKVVKKKKKKPGDKSDDKKKAA